MLAKRIRATVPITTLLVAVVALALSGCSANTPPSHPSPKIASQDTSASVLGVWVPKGKNDVKHIEFTEDGLLRQLIEPGDLNIGTWRVSGHGLVTMQLDTLGFGVPTATYRASTASDTLTLRFLSGDPWVTGASAPVTVYRRSTGHATTQTWHIPGPVLRFTVQYPRGPYHANESYPVTLTVTNAGRNPILLDPHAAALFQLKVLDGAGAVWFNSMGPTVPRRQSGPPVLQPGESRQERQDFVVTEPGAYSLHYYLLGGLPPGTPIERQGQQISVR